MCFFFFFFLSLFQLVLYVYFQIWNFYISSAMWSDRSFSKKFGIRGVLQDFFSKWYLSRVLIANGLYDAEYRFKFLQSILNQKKTKTLREITFLRLKSFTSTITNFSLLSLLQARIITADEWNVILFLWWVISWWCWQEGFELG